MNNLLKKSFVYAAIFTILTVTYTTDSYKSSNDTQISMDNSPSSTCLVLPIFCKKDT